MSPPRKADLSLALLALVLAGPALGQSAQPAAPLTLPSTPASPDDTAGAPVASLPAAVATLTPADPNSPAGAPKINERAGVDSELVKLVNFQRQVRSLRSELEVAEVQRDLAEIRGGNELTGGLTDTPELVGIYGTETNLTAEFLIGRAVLVARAGDWVTPEWRLRKILANGVELEQRGNAKPKTLLFGSRTPSANTAARAAAGSSGPMPAPLITEPGQ